jgi:hypothetical protein
MVSNGSTAINFSRLTGCAPGGITEPVELPSHRLQALACGVPVVTLAAVVQASEAELAAHVLEDRRVRRARSGPSRAASLQSPKSAESKENIEISPRSSDNMERNPLTLLLGPVSGVMIETEERRR